MEANLTFTYNSQNTINYAFYKEKSDTKTKKCLDIRYSIEYTDGSHT